MKHHAVTVLFLLLTGSLGYPQGITQISGPQHSAGDDSDMYLEQESRIEDDRQTSQQTFYPSFSPFHNPPLGHSRPFFFQQEGAYSQRGGFDHQQLTFDAPKYSGYKDTDFRGAANAESGGLLGSGNFGVIRGGTFYDKDAESSSYESDYSPFFKNGHGRPSYYGGVPNPKPHKHEQFANFRDFADINAPSNTAYSEYVVVYVNKNGTKQHEVESTTRPKNIIESLALLDVEHANQVPQKKLSRSKAKLAKLLPEKKHFHKKSRKEAKVTNDFHEPLLALS